MLFDTLLGEESVAPSGSVMPSAEGGEDVRGDQEKEKKKGCTRDEILAVLAHELGHWKLSHNLKNICIAEVGPLHKPPVLNLQSLSLTLCR